MPPGKGAAKPHPPRGSDLANGSDDDGAAAGPSGQGKTQRIAKGEPSQHICVYSYFLRGLTLRGGHAACDRCRKSKSKCEPAPSEGDPCKACAATGAGEVARGIFSWPLRELNCPSCTAFDERMHIHRYGASMLMCAFLRNLTLSCVQRPVSEEDPLKATSRPSNTDCTKLRACWLRLCRRRILARSRL